MFQVSNGKAGRVCEIFSKLTINTPERRCWSRSSVSKHNWSHYCIFIANFVTILLIGLFISIFNDEQLNLEWVSVIFCKMNLSEAELFQRFYCTKNGVFHQDFFSKFDKMHKFPRIWSHLLKKYSKENFIFCAVLMSENPKLRKQFLFPQQNWKFSFLIPRDFLKPVQFYTLHKITQNSAETMILSNIPYQEIK